MSLSKILRAVADELDRNGGNEEEVINKITTTPSPVKQNDTDKPKPTNSHLKQWAKKIAHTALWT